MLPAGWLVARGWLAAAAALPAAPGPGPPHGSSFCLPAGCCCCWLLPAAAAQPRPAGQRPARAKLVGAAGWARAWTPSSLTGTGLWKSTSIFGCTACNGNQHQFWNVFRNHSSHLMHLPQQIVEYEYRAAGPRTAVHRSTAAALPRRPRGTAALLCSAAACSCCCAARQSRRHPGIRSRIARCRPGMP
jgi:hypothetical protein